VAQFGKRRAERPASSAGFSTTAQPPVASAGPTFHTALNGGRSTDDRAHHAHRLRSV
jgi:hypothetical protein